MRNILFPIAAISSLALSGCAASIAAGVAGAALRGAGGGKSAINEDLGPAAGEACKAHASQFGQVNIIDVERRSGGKIIVWGTAGEGAERRSFECRYDGKIAGFKLRQIQTR